MESNNYYKQEQYDLALKRVKELRGFYSHLIVYIVVNTIITILIYRGLGENESLFQWEKFSVWFFWGIGLVAHGLPVFIPNIIFGKKWEQRKIQEYMDKDHANWR